jgi:acyl carrier protein
LDYVESLGGCSAILAPSRDRLRLDFMDTLTQIKKILRDTLNLSDRADRLTADSALLGGVPEFDSMAVVTVMTALENEFDITLEDDELSAEVFATVGSLAEFVSTKLAE